MLNSKLGYEIAKGWYATALVGFNTQFALGRSYDGKGDDNPVISKCFAPAYTDVSVGIDWKPNDIFSVYVSPIAGRFTTVLVSQAVNDKYAYLYPMANGGLERVLEIVEGTDVCALLGQMPACRTIVTTGGKASEELQAYFRGMGIEVKIPKVGEWVDVGVIDALRYDDGAALRWWRMPSSSRAYPMKLEKKAEYYARLFG